MIVPFMVVVAIVLASLAWVLQPLYRGAARAHPPRGVAPATPRGVPQE